MPYPLVLLNRCTPKVGDGGPMLEALRLEDRVRRGQGLPGFELRKPYDGPHDAVVSLERWQSLAEWEAVRSTLPGIPAWRSAVFDHVSPTTATAHGTTCYEVVS